MKVIVAAVGKPRDAALAAAIAHYETRAARYWPLDVREVKAEAAKDARAGTARDAEAERLMSRLDGAAVVACDERGTAMSSAAFAKFLQDARERARDLAFVIGGAHGLGDAVTNRAERRLSLAPWTLSHELARLVLAEQLYRAGTIVRGEPYHK